MFFFVPVPNRCQETLHQCIKDNVEEGTVIHTDLWRGYLGLADLNYVHRTVNHRKNFVDPNTGANTQKIERKWREVRESTQKMGTKVNYEQHFEKIVFTRRHTSDEEALHAFWYALANY